MGKTKKMAKSDLRIREQRIIQVGDQLAFEFLGPICVGKKKRGATKDSPVNRKPEDTAGKEASGTQLELSWRRVS